MCSECVSDRQKKDSVQAEGREKGTDENFVHKKRTRRCWSAFVFLIVGSILLLACNICIGSVKISLEDVGRACMGKEIDQTVSRILWDIRFPRAAAAFLLGGALGLAGYLLQTFFHNPIAGPFTLGISSGAKMVVALLMVCLLGRGIHMSSIALIMAAFLGAVFSMGIVLAMSYKVSNMSMLIVSGVMVGYICSAVTDFIVTFASDAEIVNLHNWSRGSFSGMTWENVAAAAVAVGIVFVFVFLLSKPLGAYQLGEVYAQNLGVNIRLLRAAMIVLSSALSACVVAFAGPISFVGTAVPHLMKGILGTVKPIFMIPACFLGGGMFCLFCDLLARFLFAPTELSISTVTAVFGAPVVLCIMIKRRRR